MRIQHKKIKVCDNYFKATAGGFDKYASLKSLQTEQLITSNNIEAPQTITVIGAQTTAVGGVQTVAAASQIITAATRAITAVTTHTGAYDISGLANISGLATAGSVYAAGTIISGTTSLSTHIHTGVLTGPGVSGPPV